LTGHETLWETRTQQWKHVGSSPTRSTTTSAATAIPDTASTSGGTSKPTSRPTGTRTTRTTSRTPRSPAATRTTTRRSATGSSATAGSTGAPWNQWGYERTITYHLRWESIEDQFVYDAIPALVDDQQHGRGNDQPISVNHAVVLIHQRRTGGQLGRRKDQSTSISSTRRSSHWDSTYPPSYQRGTLERFSEQTSDKHTKTQQQKRMPTLT
jgi:hypothetical protein